MPHKDGATPTSISYLLSRVGPLNNAPHLKVRSTLLGAPESEEGASLWAYRENSRGPLHLHLLRHPHPSRPQPVNSDRGWGCQNRQPATTRQSTCCFEGPRQKIICPDYVVRFFKI